LALALGDCSATDRSRPLDGGAAFDEQISLDTAPATRSSSPRWWSVSARSTCTAPRRRRTPRFESVTGCPTPSKHSAHADGDRCVRGGHPWPPGRQKPGEYSWLGPQVAPSVSHPRQLQRETAHTVGRTRPGISRLGACPRGAPSGRCRDPHALKRLELVEMRVLAVVDRHPVRTAGNAADRAPATENLSSLRRRHVVIGPARRRPPGILPSGLRTVAARAPREAVRSPAPAYGPPLPSHGSTPLWVVGRG
jgi:hypothetical protein